jgi:hypothetical protein
MNRPKAAAIIMMITVTSGRGAERVIDRFITEQMQFRALAISPSWFSQSRTEKLAAGFFNAAYGRRLIVLHMRPDGPEINRAAMFATEVDPFKHWRDQYDWMVNYTHRAAVATLIDGDAVLQYRDGRGKETRKVLKGSDPLLFRQDGIRFEIIGVQREGRESLRPVLSFLIKTDAPVEEQTALRLTEEYHARLQVPFLNLVFRTDCWFADERFYPIFTGCGVPPSKEQYRRSPIMRCTWLRGETTCRKLGGQ